MDLADFNALVRTTLIGIFVIAACLGAVVRASRFCTMGAISDVMVMGDWGRMHQWVSAIGVALVGFALLSGLGWVNPHETLYASHSVLWLSALVGGFLFGMGMVLASGCGARNLVRLGGGSFKSLVVLLVMAVAAFATLKGLTAVLRVNTVDRAVWHLGGPAFAPDLLARWVQVSLASARLALGLAVGLALLVWTLLSQWRGARDWRGMAGGMGVGLLVTAAWWLSGHVANVDEHPATLEHMYATTQSGRVEAFSFVTPVAQALDWLMFFSDANKTLTFGVVAVTGVVFGAWLQAMARRDFRWQGFADTSDLGLHLAGAVLMGIGGVTAMGCTIGQGVSAISTLHLASMPAIAAIIVGAMVALRFQLWWLGRRV